MTVTLSSDLPLQKAKLIEANLELCTPHLAWHQRVIRSESYRLPLFMNHDSIPRIQFSACIKVNSFSAFGFSERFVQNQASTSLIWTSTELTQITYGGLCPEWQELGRGTGEEQDDGSRAFSHQNRLC